MEDIKKKFGEELNTAFAMAELPASKKYDIMKKIQSEGEEDSDNGRSHYLDYIKNKKNVFEIYNTIRSKKHSKRQKREKLKEFLKNPDELNDFLNSLLEGKDTKKEESTEGTSAGGSSGVFVGPLTGSEEKTNTKNIPTVRESTEKVETKEATSSGQYSQPAIWAKSTNKKDWKGASTKYMPGAKRVQVKKKCKKFPYCNQGDINALKIFESESVQSAIDSVSSNYGYNKDYISEIVFREIRKRQK
jgi:hypothetical protein